MFVHYGESNGRSAGPDIPRIYETWTSITVFRKSHQRNIKSASWIVASWYAPF